MNSQMANKVDHTIDGKCSGCGACCSAVLCVSDAEVSKIKHYLGQHPEVKMIDRNNAFRRTSLIFVLFLVKRRNVKFMKFVQKSVVDLFVQNIKM